MHPLDQAQEPGELIPLTESPRRKIGTGEWLFHLEGEGASFASCKIIDAVGASWATVALIVACDAISPRKHWEGAERWEAQHWAEAEHSVRAEHSVAGEHSVDERDRGSSAQATRW